MVLKVDGTWPVKDLYEKRNYVKLIEKILPSGGQQELVP